MNRHIPDPPTPQDEPDVLPQKQPAERPTASADRSAATQPAAPAPQIDEELTAALRALREAWSEYTAESVRRRGQQVASGDERFLAAVGAKRGQELLEAIRALRAEARRVPDPGGPLGNYAEALSVWADTHPEIDRRELRHITHELLWANR